MSAITIPLPWPKPPLTGNRTRGNPYARASEVRTAKHEAVVAIRQANPRRIVAANVTLNFRLADKRQRDSDGMFPTLKVCQDALVDQGIIPDDWWAYVPAATCQIHPPNGYPADMWLTLNVLTERGDS